MKKQKDLSTLPLITIERDLVEDTIGKQLTDRQWSIVREEIIYQGFELQLKFKDLIKNGKFNNYLEHLDKLYQAQVHNRKTDLLDKIEREFGTIEF